MKNQNMLDIKVKKQKNWWLEKILFMKRIIMYIIPAIGNNKIFWWNYLWQQNYANKEQNNLLDEVIRLTSTQNQEI